MTEIFKAATVDEAKAAAAKKFGRDIRSIKFEIIEEGKKGLLGFGKKEAVVKASYEEKTPVSASAAKVTAAQPKQTAAPEKKSAAPVKTEKAAPEVKKEADAVPEVKAEIKKEAPAEVIVPAEEKAEISDAAPEKSADAAKDNAAVQDEEFFSLDNFTPVDETLEHPKVKLAKDYITSIFSAMDIEVNYSIYQNETGAVINIESSNNGTVIGRRGETLDAIQYLCSIIANKGDKDYFRITIDCLGYRSKRKDTLEQLAVKVAKSVIRTGRSQPLEPMNPYERRVIHSAISKIEGVSSRSVGEEPYRKIIVSSNNPRYNNRRRDNRRDGGRNDRRNDRKGGDREVTMERKSVNLATSFEKDYKRPKPEDSIEGGLYGKIEF